MLELKAIIRLYKNIRTTPIYSGYQPLFTFIPEMKKSGKIKLLGIEMLYPGDEAEVNILFLNDMYLGEDFREGKEFLFGEGLKYVGQGVVKGILYI